ncbi:hypothetical protein TESG_06263 [Trichophyton tonsurans CBS 112818]|uniref:Uncharacterized protein n=1 Tax=Trichophyton tonsurans (strain CBS 112818) TaxID=647933 RepID=F2S5Q2_TRIT1|nr:hypothetical protein TESG_06263 [Trichophyton tonsurans CBS 112818]
MGEPVRGGREGGGKTDGMCKETTPLHMLPERLIFTYKLNHDPNDMSHTAHGFWSTEILVSKFLAQREASKAEKLNILIVRIVALSDNRVSRHVTKYISTVKGKKLEWEGKRNPSGCKSEREGSKWGSGFHPPWQLRRGEKRSQCKSRAAPGPPVTGLQSPKPWWHPRQEDELESLKTLVRPERTDIGLSLEWICHPYWAMGWLSDFYLDEGVSIMELESLRRLLPELSGRLAGIYLPYSLPHPYLDETLDRYLRTYKPMRLPSSFLRSANERTFGKTTLWGGSGDSRRLQVTEARTEDVDQRTRVKSTHLWSSFECTLFILIDKGLNNLLFITRNTPEDFSPDVWMHQDILELLRIPINILANKSEFASFRHP